MAELGPKPIKAYKNLRFCVLLGLCVPVKVALGVFGGDGVDN